ncbi:unnamed protein product, partial [Choristocarpus tenellus]
SLPTPQTGQVDNCVSENKNNFFLRYTGLLVAASVIRVVEIHFMMVGHTHIKIDQIFSRKLGKMCKFDSHIVF